MSIVFAPTLREPRPHARFNGDLDGRGEDACFAVAIAVERRAARARETRDVRLDLVDRDSGGRGGRGSRGGNGDANARVRAAR